MLKRRPVKRRLWMGIACLVGIGAALGAQAQDETPLTQPTVDAIVGTLLAQTQQAPAQIAATQTIQAAIEQALTATAQPVTDSPSEALDVGAIEVDSTTEIPLLTGPGRTAAYLAPNGEYFAYFEDDSLCLYRGAEQQPCVALPDELHDIDLESIRWSPDSRYLSFHENFFVFLVDADIWVWDTQTNEVTDLTDDGENQLDFDDTNWKSIDVLADWLPDGRILFLRYSRIQGEILPPDIYSIAPGDERPEKLGVIETTDPFAIFSLDASESQLVYNYFAPGGSPSNGVWISNLDGSDAQALVPAAEENPPLGVTLSPDGRYVLIPTQGASRFLEFTPENSLMRAVDVATQTEVLIDPERFVAGAGWSPDGSALVYLVNNRRDSDENGLYITDAPGNPGRLLLAGAYNLPTPTLRQALTWGANHTILLSRSPDEGIVLVQLGV